MKKMTCKQLGGACDLEFQADSFEEMGELSRNHAREMFQQNDEAHLKAAEAMKALMQQPGSMEEWMAKKKAEFDSLPNSG